MQQLIVTVCVLLSLKIVLLSGFLGLITICYFTKIYSLYWNLIIRTFEVCVGLLITWEIIFLCFMSLSKTQKQKAKARNNK